MGFPNKRQTPDGYNHYMGLGKEVTQGPVQRKEPCWRREKAHKDDPDQHNFVIHSKKYLMPLSTAMNPSGMDQFGKYNDLVRASDTSDMYRC